MLNNITNFFNLIKTGKVKTQLDGTDLLPIGTRDNRFTGQYQPTMIKYSDLVAGLVGGSNGQVLFNDNDTIAGASNLYWDKLNERVGIGTSTPSTTFAIGSGGINRVNLGLQAFEMYTPSSVRTVFLGYSSASGQLIIASGGSNDVNFLGGGFKSISTGNFAIGSTTDAGFRLDVNGTARVKGSGTTSATTSLLIQNSAGVNLLQVRDDNLLTYASALTLSQTGTRTTFSTSGGTNVNHFRFTTLSSLSSPTGNTVFLDYIASFTPTSGVGTFSALSYTGVINQTGGASGITRGLYINPTLTAAADFRAIETTAGSVIFGGLPTSSAGLPTGAIWNDGGTLKIV